MVKMKSKYRGYCRRCDKRFNVGNWIYWNPKTKEVCHKKCINKKAQTNNLVAYRPPKGRVRFFTGKER